MFTNARRGGFCSCNGDSGEGVEDEDEGVECYAGDWNEFRIEEGDGDDSDMEDCIFE